MKTISGKIESANPAVNQKMSSSMTQTGDLYCYYTCGLHLASEIPLPELIHVSDSQVGRTDAEIVIGTLPAHLEAAKTEAPWLQVAGNTCQIGIPGIARFRVENGKKITIDHTVPDSSLEDVRAYLLGTVLAALLYQRRCVPFHISAVETPAGIWAFTGQSGAGKSTLVAWLHYHYNWAVLSDDLAVINPRDSAPVVYPGPPRIKLWSDTLDSLGLDRTGLARDLSRTDKYHLINKALFKLEPQPLTALVILERAVDSEPASITPVTGIRAYQSLMAARYRIALGMQFIAGPETHMLGGRLANQVPVYKFRRPWALSGIQASTEVLVEWIETNARQPL
jgi:hypothetical protein